MFQQSKGSRPHVGLLGPRNAGKSSLLNELCGQELSIVSPIAGTTTDPVQKAYELQPFGPIWWIDTPGYDDTGDLGALRVKRAEQVLAELDCALLVMAPDIATESEVALRALVSKLKKKNIPLIAILNKTDLLKPQELAQRLDNYQKNLHLDFRPCSVLKHQGLEEIKQRLITELTAQIPLPPLLADLVKPSLPVVLVVPIDKEAPAGRLILPQVQAIRELLDHDLPVLVVKERELHYTLTHILKEAPGLVVTDSQAFLKVHADTPAQVPMTSFSILFARQRGDILAYVQGVQAINSLPENGRILIAELCAHRPITEDIGRVKIPRWLKQYTGKKLNFEVKSGHDFPEDLTSYDLIIQCGGCMANRAYIISRIRQAQVQKVAITNYGVAIAFLHGILPRALQPLGL